MYVRFILYHHFQQPDYKSKIIYIYMLHRRRKTRSAVCRRRRTNSDQRSLMLHIILQHITLFYYAAYNLCWISRRTPCRLSNKFCEWEFSFLAVKVLINWNDFDKHGQKSNKNYIKSVIQFDRSVNVELASTVSSLFIL